MYTTEIENNLAAFTLEQKLSILTVFKMVINSILSSNSSMDYVTSILNDVGFKVTNEDINNAISIDSKHKFLECEYSEDQLEAIQAVENTLIFDDNSCDIYIDRCKKSSFNIFNSKVGISLTIRQIAINLCEEFSNQFPVFHSRDINFASASRINYEQGYPAGFISVWFNINDAASMFGNQWRYKIEDFIGIITNKTCKSNTVQYAILPAQFEAIHIKIYLGE